MTLRLPRWFVLFALLTGCPGPEETPDVGALDAPSPGVDAPSPEVDAPELGVDAPSPEVDAPAPGVDAPSTGVDAPVADLDAGPAPSGEPGAPGPYALGAPITDTVVRGSRRTPVRALVPTVRVDANGGWTLEQAVAAAAALSADGPLEYLEQPCATVAELALLRRRINIPVAADESIRRAADPLAVVRAGAVDIAVLKVAPLGGVAALLRIAAAIDIPVVISSALDSAVGIAAGLAAAAALPRLEHACGLGTGGLFVDDVADLPVVDGCLAVADVVPDPARLADLAAPAERRDWWIARVRACQALLPAQHC